MNCDRIARVYRWLEYAALGRQLERRRFAFLNDVAGTGRALMLGEGDGRFLRAFASANPQCLIDYVDASAGMLAIARSGCERAGISNVRFHHADALQWRGPDTGYDLIVSHFFLDCLDDSQVTRLVGRLLDDASPAARWIVSEFEIPTHPLKRTLAKIYIGTLYRFFRITTALRNQGLPAYAEIFQRSGLALVAKQHGIAGLVTSELWTVSRARSRQGR
jgi:ubiquinone/menaquinone biosynthesis C-methylase UbiE